MENKITKTDNRRKIEGVVVGNSMEKTVKVRVDTLEAHPVYKKRVKRKKVYFARTEKELNIGDKVVIEECRPYSKKVRWIVIDKVEEKKK
ncbi:MAG TPA: uS17 family ribosomal protein [Candidatus Dojkabacteria bacterium]|nr:uS17 family ribosomal protein [Candidatus Dojkabacteria bacterium]